MNPTIEIMKQLINYVFEQGDYLKAVSLLSDDVFICGLPNDRVVRGQKDLYELVKEYTANGFSRCLINYWDEQVINDHSAMVAVTLTNQGYDLKYRISASTEVKDGTTKIFGLQLSIIRDDHNDNMFQTMAQDDFQNLKSDLINKTLPGGMLGGYYKKGYPFYFINKRMLDYLGYQDEQEFIKETKGLNSNCIHPSDRLIVSKKIDEAVKNNVEYNIDYRIQKKDGNYIWVHNVGQLVEIETNQKIIVSVCYDITSQVRLKEELENNKEIMHAASDFANMFVFTYDITKDEVYPNKSLQEGFGFGPIVKDFPESVLTYDYVLDEYNQTYLDAFKQIKAGKNQVEFEIQTKYPDMSTHWMRFKVNRLSSSSSLAVITAQPIDEEKALEIMINSERKKLRQNDTNYIAYIVINVTTGMIVEHESYAGEITSIHPMMPLDISISKDAINIPYESEYQEFVKFHNIEYMQECLNNGITSLSIDYRRKTPDGKIMWTRDVGNLLYDPSNGDLMMYEYCYDINDQKMLEEAINGIICNTSERLGSLNLVNGQITLFLKKPNQQNISIEIGDYRDLSIEYCKERVLEEDQEMFMENVSIDTIIKVLHKSPTYEFTCRVKDNGQIRYKRNLIMMYDKESQSVLINRIDITNTIKEQTLQSQKLKEALVAAKAADKAKMDFLSRMSHDIRTPMNAILGITALTLDDCDKPRIVKENMNKIKNSGDYLLGLINDILDMSKIESGTMILHKEPYAYSDFLENIKVMFEPLCKQKGINFEFEEVVVKTVVETDKVRLNQIFFNIFSNAIKFTDVGGTVSYHTENIKFENHHISADYIISDTGIGISEDFIGKMFDPFSQEDNSVASDLQGTGLGLSITKKLV